MVKLSPNVSDIKQTAKAAEEAGADAISLINTLIGMAIETKSRRPSLANVTGGLSGPAIKPIALRMVWEAAGTVGIPVVGMGGITTADDAVQFMMAGARAVMIGAANIIDPMAGPRIIGGLAEFLEDNEIDGVADLVGSLKIEKNIPKRSCHERDQ
jgi:dihydroorotate dehydrogenase (NAD+) catalytic subunit